MVAILDCGIGVSLGYLIFQATQLLMIYAEMSLKTLSLSGFSVHMKVSLRDDFKSLKIFCTLYVYEVKFLIFTFLFADVLISLILLSCLLICRNPLRNSAQLSVSLDLKTEVD